MQHKRLLSKTGTAEDMWKHHSHSTGFRFLLFKLKDVLKSSFKKREALGHCQLSGLVEDVPKPKRKAQGLFNSNWQSGKTQIKSLLQGKRCSSERVEVHWL